MTLILSNDDVRALLSMSDVIAALDTAYRELAEGRGTNRRRMDSFAPTRRQDALYSLKSIDGIDPASGVAAIRVTSSIMTWPTKAGAMRQEKIPSAAGARGVGLVLLFSTETGEPLAILPDEVLQRLRVGATNALGIRYLARPETPTVAIIGSGWQAGGQLMGICAVRRVERFRCYSPSEERRRAFARQWSEALGLPVEPVASPHEAVRGADVVLCATNSAAPVFLEPWIEPGMHLSCIRLAEIEPAAIRRAERVVIHTREAESERITSAGVAIPETRARSTDAVDPSSLPELTDLLSGRTAGRGSPEEVTCFLNSIGLGIQFAAAGAVLYRRAVERGVGRALPTEWFTQEMHR